MPEPFVQRKNTGVDSYSQRKIPSHSFLEYFKNIKILVHIGKHGWPTYLPCHGNSIEHAVRAEVRYASCRCDGILPLCGSFCPEDPQCGSGDEVALQVEGVVNGGVHAEKTLGGSSRLEPLQLALSSSLRLMQVLRAI